MWTDPHSKLATVRNDLQVDRGVSFETARARLQSEAAPGDGSGFFISRRPMFGTHLVLLGVMRPGAGNMVSVCRPNTGAHAAASYELCAGGQSGGRALQQSWSSSSSTNGLQKPVASIRTPAPGHACAAIATRRAFAAVAAWHAHAVQPALCSTCTCSADTPIHAGLSFFDMDRFELLGKYEPLSEEDAQQRWEELFEQSLHRCMHGAACTLGGSCAQGKRIMPVRAAALHHMSMC